jgi:hypothetical protein
MSLCLASAHGFGYPLSDFLFLSSADLVQVDALGHELFQHLAHQIFVDVVGIEVRGAQQRAQAGLVLNGAGWHDGPGGGGAGRMLAGRASWVASPTRVTACVAAALSPRCGLYNARVPQAPLLGRLEHALLGVGMGVVALLTAPELGQDIVAGRVPGAVGLLVVGRLASVGVRLEEDVEQRRDGGIGLRGAHRGPARRACVGVYRRGRRGLEGEPFFQTGAAEGVQAVEQRERLEEHVGTDLDMAELASPPLDMDLTYRARKLLF